MLPFDEIKKYSSEVLDQIRWKKAKPIIASEIENHIVDQRDAYMDTGENEENATIKAIKQMGDPVAIGQDLDKTHRPKPQWTMLIFTGLIMMVGVWADYAFNLSEKGEGGLNILSFAILFGILVTCYFLDFTLLGKYAKQIYFGSLAIPFLFQIISFRNTIIAGRIYFGEYGGDSIRITYIAFILPLIFALAVYEMKNKGYKGIVLSGLAYLPFAVTFLLIPSSAGLIIYTLSALGILSFAIYKGWFGVNKKQGLLLVWVPTLVVFLGIVILVIKSDPLRIMSLIEPEVYRREGGFWYFMTREFLRNSVFLGKGAIPTLYAGDFASFPIIDKDYLLTYLIHEFGFGLLIVIVGLIVVFSVIGIRKVLKQKSMLASLIGMAIMLTFIFQTVFYIMGNLGFSIFEPMSLPFISYGLTAKCINAALVGFMLSTFRTGDVFMDRFRPSTETSIMDNSFCSYKDGKLVIQIKKSKIVN